MKETKILEPVVNRISIEMEEILRADPSRWVDYIGLSVDDSEIAMAEMDIEEYPKVQRKDARESIITAMGLYRPRRHKPTSFCSQKPGHSSKERRFVKAFSSRSRIHSAGGKGSKHKSNEDDLNHGFHSLRRSGRPCRQLDDSFERYCRTPKSDGDNPILN